MATGRAGQLFDQEMPEPARAQSVVDPTTELAVTGAPGPEGAPVGRGGRAGPGGRVGRGGRAGPQHLRRGIRLWAFRWTKWRVAGLLVLLALAPVAWSYGHALTYPGTDSVALRTTEWLKDHGFRREVLWVEREWYLHHAPKVGAKLKAGSIPVPRPTTPTSALPAGAVSPPIICPQNVKPFVANPVPGEGVWQGAGRYVSGRPAICTTFLRPDAIHTGLVTGVAWMNESMLKAELFAGTSDPGGSGWVNHSPIPIDLRPNVYATFNSGFKLKDSNGGYYAEGRTVKPLVPGEASLVFHTDGTATVAEWGRDATMGPDIAAVRQNLRLIVDGGAPVPSLGTDNYTLWGYTLGNKVLVWRSGVGVDDHGNLIYAAGNGLSVQTLAQVLAAAGAVRAMELDINSSWVDFMTYDGGAAGTPVVPTKLLSGMLPAADKYYHLSSRDFIVLLGR
jgi:hypothetical protein